MAWIAGLWLVNTALLIIIAVREVRRPAKALTWISVGLVLPIIGFVCYLFVTNPVQMRRDKLVSSHNNPIAFLQHVVTPLLLSLGLCNLCLSVAFEPVTSKSSRTGWKPTENSFNQFRPHKRQSILNITYTGMTISVNVSQMC
ncbi:PLD nuclease N-terminal domain-containing protein [Paenibacillus sp.]|uniref:PLD nuclease N-terminal domain-containing protein n=1 Tax=Paenibacillus sp. TaxID=58172 RepID=UPI003568B4F4